MLITQLAALFPDVLHWIEAKATEAYVKEDQEFEEINQMLQGITTSFLELDDANFGTPRLTTYMSKSEITPPWAADFGESQLATFSQSQMLPPPPHESICSILDGRSPDAAASRDSPAEPHMLQQSSPSTSANSSCRVGTPDAAAAVSKDAAVAPHALPPPPPLAPANSSCGGQSCDDGATAAAAAAAAAAATRFASGMIFKASAKTYRECVARKLFGLPSNQWDRQAPRYPPGIPW